MVITRDHIASYLDGVFDTPPASRTRLLDAAASSGAGDSVLRLLEDLPDSSYVSLDDVWHHLPGIPVRY